MKIVGIFNNKEEQIGFKLAGIETNFIEQKEELSNLLDKINKDKTIGILVINDGIYKMMPEEFNKLKLKKSPLIINVNK